MSAPAPILLFQPGHEVGQVPGRERYGRCIGSVAGWPGLGATMSVTFEQARAILAEDLDMEGDGRRVAEWGWENDELFVLAFDTTVRATADGLGSDEDEDYVADDPELDGWGTPEDLAAVREHVRLVPAGWDPWEGRPAEVPVVDKATGQLRWEIPSSLGAPVAPNLRPIGDVPGSETTED